MGPGFGSWLGCGSGVWVVGDGVGVVVVVFGCDRCFWGWFLVVFGLGPVTFGCGFLNGFALVGFKSGCVMGLCVWVCVCVGLLWFFEWVCSGGFQSGLLWFLA